MSSSCCHHDHRRGELSYAEIGEAMTIGVGRKSKKHGETLQVISPRKREEMIDANHFSGASRFSLQYIVPTNQNQGIATAWLERATSVEKRKSSDRSRDHRSRSWSSWDRTWETHVWTRRDTTSGAVATGLLPQANSHGPLEMPFRCLSVLDDMHMTLCSWNLMVNVQNHVDVGPWCSK